jgi:hypothetical protein
MVLQEKTATNGMNGSDGAVKDGADADEIG